MIRTRFAIAFSTYAVLILGQAITSGQEDAETPTLFTNANIFDGVSEKLDPGSVLIEGNIIKDVGSDVKAPPNTRVVDFH